ncbi:hypothetical protein TNCV_2916711 [Trichonephila clavipes]|nr:hypothetical protein TNCV_2916711 [Trichonephila clavipes]
MCQFVGTIHRFLDFVTAVKIKINFLIFSGGSACCVSSRTPVCKLCVGNQQAHRINSHSGRRKYGPKICTVRLVKPEANCSGYTSASAIHSTYC